MAESQSQPAVVEEISEDGLPTGLEAERTDEALADGIERPFDPEKIKVARETKTISLITTRISHGEIDLAPEFQRRARIWDNGRKSRLIESILLKIPLPVFYVASDFSDSWAVVDGLQRLTTIQDFITGKIRLSGLEYLTQFSSFRFLDLPRSMQRRIEETELVVNVIQPGTPEEVMFNIFSRINTGGITLNGQEIRHAINKGPARKFLQELAESKQFARATSRSISDQRMAARECSLRFLAFHMSSWENYDTSDLDGFLNAAMQRVNKEKDRLPELRAAFDRSMESSYAIFGRDAFRKRYFEQAPRNPISKALFEVWSVSLAALSTDELKVAVERGREIRERFIDLMRHDREFEVSISYSTGSPRRVHKRFSAVEQLITHTLRS